jgi:hypothetical protein
VILFVFFHPSKTVAAALNGAAKARGVEATNAGKNRNYRRQTDEFAGNDSLPLVPLPPPEAVPEHEWVAQKCSTFGTCQVCCPARYAKT